MQFIYPRVFLFHIFVFVFSSLSKSPVVKIDMLYLPRATHAMWTTTALSWGNSYRYNLLEYQRQKHWIWTHDANSPPPWYSSTQRKHDRFISYHLNNKTWFCFLIYTTYQYTSWNQIKIFLMQKSNELFSQSYRNFINTINIKWFINDCIA